GKAQHLSISASQSPLAALTSARVSTGSPSFVSPDSSPNTRLKNPVKSSLLLRKSKVRSPDVLKAAQLCLLPELWEQQHAPMKINRRVQCWLYAIRVSYKQHRINVSSRTDFWHLIAPAASCCDPASLSARPQEVTLQYLSASVSCSAHIDSVTFMRAMRGRHCCQAEAKSNVEQDYTSTCNLWQRASEHDT
ncbi:hypothetical protein JOQ06_000560, partial [Pogonophryne albipinna]